MTGTATTVVAARRGNVVAAAVAAPRSAGPAEAPASMLEVMDRLVEVLAAEIGPERVGDPELGVRRLPEEEVRDAELPARPDEEIGIGETVGVELVLDERFVDAGERQVLLPVGLHDAPHGVDDLGPPAVA